MKTTYSLVKNLSLLSATVAVASVISLVGANKASAATAYLTNPSAVGDQTFSGILGLDFTVNSSIQVTELGAFDSDSNGIAGPVTTQIWARSGNSAVGTTPLASLTFPTSGATLTGGYSFANISTLTLNPGTYTLVSYGYSSVDPNGNTGFGFSPVITDNDGGLISFGSSRYSTTLGAAGGYIGTATDTNVYAAGSFIYAATPIVPEPLTLGGTAIAAGIGLWLKKKQDSFQKTNP
jgi:hypothetical protein